MLIGQDRSGKTSLKKSLQGIPFNPHEDSTVGIDTDPSYFKVTSETWRIGEKDQATNKEANISYEHNLALQLVKRLKHDRNLTKTETEAQSVTERNEVDRDPADTSKAEKDHNHPFETTVHCRSSTKRDDPLSPQKTLKEIESLLPDLLAVDEIESEDDIYSVLWDFAGESVYYETHTLFLTSRAIFLLTYDLSQDPAKKAPPVKRKGMFEVTEDMIGTKTNLGYLDFWMTSVSSLSSQGKDHKVHPASPSIVLPETPVFLVCTHADKLCGRKNPRDLARKVYGELSKKRYKARLYGPFVVDNTKSSQKPECPGVSRLREKIREVAKELPQMKEFIPIKWLKFEKIFRVFLGEGYKWIFIEKAKQIAYDFCQIRDDAEFKAALDFLHDQKILLHFDHTDKLNKIVFLDLQWLIDIMKKVITVKSHDDDEETALMDLWCQLEEKGILEEKLLKHLWGPLIGEHAVFENLVGILENFSLVCSWPESGNLKRYLVPSMLRSHPPQEITQLIASANLPSLFIKFKPGQVPSHLFPRLVTQFLLWGKGHFCSSRNPQLYQNFARLYTAKDDKCSVVLLCHSSLIEIVVHGGNDSSEVCRFAQSVFKQLRSILDFMSKEFFWLKNMSYQAGVLCTVCSRGRKVEYCHLHDKNNCEREECLHFIPYSELSSADESITCTRSTTARNSKVFIKDFSAWLDSCQKVIESSLDSYVLQLIYFSIIF